jgi:hypothetical protein
MQQCCQVCVQLEHGDHDVRKVWEVFKSLAEEVTCIAQDQERKSSDLKRSASVLRILKGSVVTARRDVLIREIEDHAEQCIKRMLKQKNEQKEKVHNDYKVVADVLDWLDKVAGLGELDNRVAKATTLLSVAEPHARDIEQLNAIKNEILRIGMPGEMDVDGYWESFEQLFDNPLHFVPNGIDYNIGKLESRNLIDERSCILIFTKELKICDKEMYIPCVANLGNGLYAVAHPTHPGKPSDAIDIYKVPGEFQQTLTQHVNPMYDIAATPDGKLAILSVGSTDDSCCVRLFDPEAGYERCTKDISIRGPLSFDVNAHHQYIILSNDEGRRVSVVDEDGSFRHTMSVDEYFGISDASRIACCAKDMFVLTGTRNNLFVFKSMGDALSECIHHAGSFFVGVRQQDISSTWFGEISLGDVSMHHYNMRLGILRNGSFSNLNPDSRSWKVPKGVTAVIRLSMRDNYVVYAMNNTIRVYTIDHEDMYSIATFQELPLYENTCQ